MPDKITNGKVSALFNLRQNGLLFSLRISLPEDALRGDGELVSAVLDNAGTMMQRFAVGVGIGGDVEFTGDLKGRISKVKARQEKIRELFDGSNYAELAEAFCLTERRIRQIVTPGKGGNEITQEER